jgi:hypothetical protein
MLRGKKLGAPLAGTIKGLAAAPRRDLRVIARQQHVRYAQAAELGRARVLWVFEQTFR